MHYIKKIIDHIDDEIESAKDYAEKYVECKAKGNSAHAARYKSMAEDELRHASFFHELAVKEIDEISKIYSAPAEMLKEWEKNHAEYVESAAWIKQMLLM